jgi:hypothetical protein
MERMVASGACCYQLRVTPDVCPTLFESSNGVGLSTAKAYPVNLGS